LQRGRRNEWCIMVFGVLVLYLSCCTSENPALERAKRVEKSKGDIVLGAAVPLQTPKGIGAWHGIQLALSELNTAGGILRRKFQVIKKDDGGSVSKGEAAAQFFVEKKDLFAVIGHLDSYVSVPTSVMYNYHGILMISPLSTDPDFTRQGFNLVFRNIPSDNTIGENLARFCRMRGYEDMIIYHVSSDYGAGLATAFEKSADPLDINIIERTAYDAGSGPEVFKREVIRWNKYFKYDAVMLAGVMPEAASFIKEIRKQGVTCPIITGDNLDSDVLLETIGTAAEGISIATTFNPKSPREEVQRFVAEFRNKYGSPPGLAAAQGYDALKVLAYAVGRAGTTNPFKVAESLRSVKNWLGVTGDHTFGPKGDVVNKRILIKTVENGRFDYLSLAEVPPAKP